MGDDSLAEITPNAPEFICPICLPKPKSSGFQCKKTSLGIRSQSVAKIPQMPQNLFAQFVCPSPKVLDFNEKRLHCA
jgi:hypothetical protein